MIPQTIQIGQFALGAQYDDIPPSTADQLKRHLLDSIGSFIFAQDQLPVIKLRNAFSDLQGENRIIPIRDLSFDKLSQYFTALIRYPDFMDNFLGKESTCHPSDNIGPLLAADKLVSLSGKDFLLAMAIGYQIECRLTKEMPVMIEGYDHTALLAFSVTAELARVLSLTEAETACALGMAGCAFNPLVTCRTAYTTEWKGFASSSVNAGCAMIVLLAKNKMTGPVDLFEKPVKGYDAIYGMDLKYDWTTENFDLIPRCILKSYNAEVHSQSAVEAALELRAEHSFNPSEIETVDISTFLNAYHIVGGGEYGDRKTVFTKEAGDHSMPYVVAVAILDGQVYPEQLYPERIMQPDVQELLQKVNIHTTSPIHKPVKLAGILDKKTDAYPDKLISEVTIELKNGEKFSLEKESYKGFFLNPLSWEDVIKKFKKLTGNKVSETTKDEIIDIVQNLETHDVSDLLQKIVIE
ncbi:MAG TPA: MmgE/PrpD family protein [Hanamia sp.]|nr:MmgE/PrpD family protein [Hanamia sp.]